MTVALPGLGARDERSGEPFRLYQRVGDVDKPRLVLKPIVHERSVARGLSENDEFHLRAQLRRFAPSEPLQDGGLFVGGQAHAPDEMVLAERFGLALVLPA